MFLEVLTFVVATCIAQTILTLRSVLSAGDDFVLITAEWNRIYAITNRNRMIASLFCVAMISQLAIGLYLTANTIVRGGESVTHYSYLAYNVSVKPAIPIPIPLYMMCASVGKWPLRIGFSAVSLVYGTKPLSLFISETSTLIIPQIF